MYLHYKTSVGGRMLRSWCFYLVLISCLAGWSASAATRAWTGAGANDDWSAGANWSGSVASGDDLIFGDGDATGTPGGDGTPNNVVDLAFGNTLRSLFYTNLSGFHHTRIDAPRLTISGTASATVFQVGTGAGNDVDQLINVTITGNALAISNTASTFNVRQTATNAGIHRATLDMSKLNNFTGNVNLFAVARGTETSTAPQFNRPQATVLLARTNLINATNEVVVGHAASNPGNGVAELLLGQENIFNVGVVFRTGYRKATAVVGFQTNLTNPTLKMRALNGTGRLASWTIADNGAGDTGTNHGATNDFTGGIMDALVNSLFVAKTYSGTTTGTGVSRGRLAFDEGVIDVNTLEVGHHTAANGGNAIGVVDVGGTGELRVNSMLRLAYKQGTRDPEGTVNVMGGKLSVAGDVVHGGGKSTLNVTNGVVDMQPAGDATPGMLAVKYLNTENAVLTNLGGLYVDEMSLGASDKLAFNSNAVFNLFGKGVAGMSFVYGGAEFNFNDKSRWQVDLNDGGGQSDQLWLINAQPKLSGTVYVEVNAVSGSLPNNTYTLLNSSWPIGGTAQNLAVYGPLADSRHTFSFNVGANDISMTVGGSDSASLVWSGDGGANLWNLKGAANWNGGTEKFYQVDQVIFDDAGSAAAPVQLSGVLVPSSVTLSNNAKNYTFAGTGMISGTSGLTLEGTGKVTVLTTNDNTGVTTINAGVLQVGDGLAENGGLGSGVISNSATLIYAPATTQTVANVISGPGSVVKSSAGHLGISGANSYAGVTVITQGVVQVFNGSALGTTAGGTYVTNGATLDLNDQNVGLEPVFVSGAGVNGQGAIYEGNASGAVLQQLRDVTMLGDTTFGGVGRYDIRNGATTDPGLRGNGFKLTKVGASFLAIVAPSTGWNVGLGDVDVQAGALAFEQACILGVPTGTITIRSNANVQIYDAKATNVLVKNIVMEDGALMTFSGPAAGGATNIFGGTLTLNGTNRFNVTGISRTFWQTPIGGTGAFHKQGNGTNYFGAANTYSGATIISSGAPLMLLPGGSIANSSEIALNSGQLDVSLVPGFALASNQKLVGVGSVVGSVSIPATGTLIPGAPIGTMWFSNNLTMGGTTVMEINKAVGATNDLVAVSGALTFGGKLVVTNAGGALSVGDKFQLFSKAGADAFSSVEFPAGYEFANNLGTDGSISVTAVLVPTTPTNVVYAVNGSTLTISWPAEYLGWRLETQVNPNSVGLSNNWQTVAGSASVTSMNLTIDPSGPGVFYRLVYP